MKIRFEAADYCPKCGGHERKEPCKWCGGSGKWHRTQYRYINAVEEITEQINGFYNGGSTGR